MGLHPRVLPSDGCLTPPNNPRPSRMYRDVVHVLWVGFVVCAVCLTPMVWLLLHVFVQSQRLEIGPPWAGQSPRRIRVAQMHSSSFTSDAPPWRSFQAAPAPHWMSRPPHRSVA